MMDEVRDASEGGQRKGVGGVSGGGGVTRRETWESYVLLRCVAPL